MLILGNKRWANQPPLGAQINFGHPLAKGLTFYTLFNAGAGTQKALLPLNLPGNALGTVPAPNWINTDGARSQNFNANWSVWYERGPWVEPPTNVSLVMRLRRTGSAASPVEKTFGNGTTNPFTSYAIEWNPGGAGQDSYRADINTGGVFFGGTTVNLGAGFTQKPTTLALTYTSGSLKTYANGINKSTDAPTGTITYDTTSAGRLIVSGSSSAAAANEWNGQIYYVGVWNRVLTPSENEWLHYEPYAMLMPRKEISYFPVTNRAYSYYITLEKLWPLS